MFVVVPIVAVLAAVAQPLAAAVSWTQYQGDAAHSGSIPVGVSAAGLTPLWSTSAAQLQEGSLITGGVVTDADHIYLSANYAGSTDQVVALNRSNGTVAWRQNFVPYSGSISPPSVGNGKVYVHLWGHSGISGGNASQYPYVDGMDALSGALQFATSHSGQWSSGSRPTVAGGQLFAAGGYYGGLDSYNAVSGAHGWFAGVNQQYGWIPTADAQRVYVYMGPASASPGPQVGTLYAFNRVTGALDFSILNPADPFTLYNGTCFLGQQNDALTLTYNQTITSFDLASRTVRWRASATSGQGIAIDDGLVFVGNGVELDVLNEASGAVSGKWFAPAGQALSGNIVVTDNVIFARTGQGTYAIDRGTLQTVWSTATVGDIAVGDGMLLISNGGAVSAFALPEPATPVAALFMTLAPLLRRARRRTRP